MVIFDLECINGHAFEGWFEDKEDLENQQQKGILTCPVCDTRSVVQKLHPIAIKKSTADQGKQALQAGRKAIAELTDKVAEYVEKNFEDVGTDFTRQALKMHYGVEDHQNIRGTTTKEEDKLLAKEGVPVLRLPTTKKKVKEELN